MDSFILIYSLSMNLSCFVKSLSFSDAILLILSMSVFSSRMVFCVVPCNSLSFKNNRLLLCSI